MRRQLPNPRELAPLMRFSRPRLDRTAARLARAEAVRRFMSREGIALNRISTISYGDTAPVAGPDSTAKR